MDTLTEYPGDKVYYAADGHEYVVSPQQARDGRWFYVYSLSYHSDECRCWNDEDGDYGSSESYAGEEW